MKNRTKLFGIATAIIVISFSGCKKDTISPISSFDMELAGEEENIRLAQSGYSTSTPTPLEMANGSECYTKGVIEYKINNETVAIVDFGDGRMDESARLTKGGEHKDFNLRRKKQHSKFKKVIVKPLIKTDDCKYIVEGIIKFFDNQTGEYLATIDFGNGSCDEWATKSWPASAKESAGSKIFSLDDWCKGHKRKGKK